MLDGKRRFLSALRCEKVDRPPVWLMRQAGRVLPEYRALREKYSFLDLVRTPELCAEVTLQPLQRFNFDVAIIFSDILVIPEALGQGYSFRPQGGIAMDFALNPEEFRTRLNWKNITDRLGYVRQALSLVRDKLDGKNALIGFSGSPWTLACFMTEGGHVDASKKLRAIQWYQDNPAEFDAFMNLLADALTEYLLMQWAEGIDSAQIFDSLSTLVPLDLYWELSGKYIDRILRNLGKDRPMIVYSKGEAWKSYIPTPAQVLSVDWTQSLSLVKKSVGSQRCVQGNLDPMLLTRSPEEVRQAAKSLLEEMRGMNGFILNLGHGVLPDGKIECIEALMSELNNSPVKSE